jgi:hypothetical protein
MSSAPIPNFGLASFKDEGSFFSDPLLADGHHVVTKRALLAAASGFVKRGTLVAINYTTGAAVLADSGSNAPNGVVAENADATTVAAEVLVYTSGRMKADAIIWPTTGSRGLFIDKLRDYGILIESVLTKEGGYTSTVLAVTLTPVSATPTAAGGSTTFAVAKDNAADVGTWFWTKDAAYTWITVTAPTVAQSANGTVSYTVAVNAVGQPQRIGYIVVNGQSFKITQAAG